jgi:hypothetical protein
MSLVFATSKGVTTNPEKDPAIDPLIPLIYPGITTSDSFFFYFNAITFLLDIFKTS